jgi:hypothetical protein
MTRRSLRVAFLAGAIVYGVLLAGAYWGGPLSQVATMALLIFALPGAMVGMSSEVIHPTGIGVAALVLAASAVNGLAYAGVATIGSWLLRRRRKAA